MSLHARHEIRVDALGSAPQRQFTQRGQVLRLEKAFDRARRGVLHIDLAFGQPLEQFIGREVDQDDFIGLVEHRVWHGLAHPHLGDFQHHIVEAFEVLDVQRRPHIDAGGEQFVDVLPALRMAAARNIGVRVFIDQQQAGAALERRVQIELLHDLIAIDDRQARQNVEAFELALGFAAAMRLDQPSDDIATTRLIGLRGCQHCESLPDAGSSAKKYLQMAAPFLAGERKKGVGGSALLGIEGHAAPF